MKYPGKKHIIFLYKKLFYPLFEPVLGHSRIVLLTKRGLLLLALLLTILLISLPLLQSSHENFKISFQHLEKTTASNQPKMINPTLQGVDKNNQPYTIKAKEAIQQNLHTYILNTITARISLNDQKWISAQADSAFLNHKEEHLHLQGNIHLMTDEGYELRTASLDIDLKSQHMTGTQTVVGEGPAGLLTAEGMEVKNRGETITFTPNVYLKLYPKAQ